MRILEFFTLSLGAGWSYRLMWLTSIAPLKPKSLAFKLNTPLLAAMTFSVANLCTNLQNDGAGSVKSHDVWHSMCSSQSSKKRHTEIGCDISHSATIGTPTICNVELITIYFWGFDRFPNMIAGNLNFVNSWDETLLQKYELSCIVGGYHYLQANNFYKKVEYLQDIKIYKQSTP